jgi:hypothetical protein
MKHWPSRWKGIEAAAKTWVLKRIAFSTHRRIVQLRLAHISVGALFIALSDPACAGPPFVTDDPEPVDHHRWEVNYALAATWGQGQTSAGIPSVDINYGVVPNVQLHAQPRYSYERSGQDVHSGVDDTEIGVKYRFLNVEGETSTLMVGIYPMYQVATGARGLGPDRGKRQVFLPLWIQRDSEKWTVYGGYGYRINPGAGNRNAHFLGATALYNVMHGLQLGAELFRKTADTVDGTGVTGINFGGIYELTRDYNLLFSAGPRFNDGMQRSAYVALQAHF